MSAPRRRLSKSRLVSAQQCPKRLYLETFDRELAETSAQAEAMFETGHEVGAIAQALYGTDESVEIPFNPNMNAMVEETKALLDAGADYPVFEATFEHEDVLVRVDVLMPEDDGWRIVEVKSSTSVKDYHLVDCGAQWWVLRGAGISVTGVSLTHVNNQFVYLGDDNYSGMLTENDVTEAAAPFMSSTATNVEAAKKILDGPTPETPVGAHCYKPFECPFVNHCWPMSVEYPVSGLKGSKAKIGEFVVAGYKDIQDVPAELLATDTQRRIHAVTMSGVAEVLDGAKQLLEELEYPRYYLDFETIAPAIPLWADTRPYETLPVQWSCHIDDGSGDGSSEAMQHEEFLDLSGEAPMRKLAEALIECLGDSGPVLMYTSYEKQVIMGLAERFPDLKCPLNAIVDRLFDLHPVVKAHYYHPRMLGSWSIKAVLPTMNPEMDYEALEGIKEGTAASGGYLDAINPETDEVRKLELEEQLLRYCRFDTEAMVEIVRFFTLENPGSSQSS